MKTVLMAGIAAAGLIGVSPLLAQAPHPGSAAAEAAAGKVHTRAEVQTKVASHFASVDADKDGFVTKAEADAAMAAMHAKIGERMSRRTMDPGHLFDRLDSNKDGRVTRAEADAAMAARQARRAENRASRGAGMFDRLDSNRDGSVSRAEFDAAHAQRVERKEDRVERRGERRMGALGGHMFIMADADKDGRVSLQEATAAALQHFDMADSNRDGQVTREERRQMHQKMRGAHHQHQRS